MIITRTWLEEFIDIENISTNDICKTLNSIGLEVDGVEKISIPKKVVIGKVISKQKHPDADKLNICKVDIGDEILQIVCGAKNVDVEQFVPVATNGCNLGNNFIIKKAKLRGVESNGMICSSSEIGLPKLADGILILDDSIGELILGKELSEYKYLNDDIIEIELTANRGDCLSINGVARELSTYYGIPLIPFEKSIVSNEYGIGQILEIRCDSSIDSSLIYKAVDFTNFKLQFLYQLRVGIIDSFCEKSDIENALNYVIHSTGVILNAYSKKDTLVENQLNILEIKKDNDGFDNTYSNTSLSKIGVEHKELREDGEYFILEASYINPELISKQVYETKIKTGDVFYRTSRGSEPNVEYGIDYLATFVSKNGALIYKGRESFVEDKEKLVLDVSLNKINCIIGQDIEKNEIEKILTALGFEVKDNLNNVLTLKIPLFRHDIKNIADVTEEIVRIVGIDNIKAKPLEISEVNRVNKTAIDLSKQNKLRFKAIQQGFYETLTYVFASKENLEKYGFETVKKDFEIINPIAKELNTFRTTLLLNLVEAASNNIKIGAKSISFFEIGTIFNQNRDEFKKLSLIQTGAKENEDVVNAGKPENIDFFTFAKKISNIIGQFDLEVMTSFDNSFIHPYQNANIIVDNKVIGSISKLHPSICEDYNLSDTFICEVNFNDIKDDLVTVNSYSKFQASKKDLSIIVPKSMEYKEIKKQINSLQNDTIKQFNLIDVYTDEILADNESLTIRFVLQSDNKTLEEEDITSTMNSILEVLEKNLNIGLRK